MAGTITGVRFYKGPQNTGTHTGDLWSATGTLLATATFTGESTAGWQQVSFATPVAITASTTYVASYHTNVGHYSLDRGPVQRRRGGQRAAARPGHRLGGNGVYAYGASRPSRRARTTQQLLGRRRVLDHRRRDAAHGVSTTPGHGATNVAVPGTVAPR